MSTASPDPAVGSSFKRTPEGWYKAVPSNETVEWAIQTTAAGDRTKPNNMLNFSKNRAGGLVAEKAFHLWLEERQVAHVWNGGTDPKPDFQIGSLRVGVKECGRNDKPWNPRLVVNIYHRHKPLPLDEVFFVGYERITGKKTPEIDKERVVLLGGLTKDDYFDKATLVRKGGQINPDTPAQNDVWNLKTRLLEPPDKWLERVLAAATAAAAG